MNDRTLIMVMTRGIGANLTDDEKRAHLIDLKREHLIDQVCTQEILPPEKIDTFAFRIVMGLNWRLVAFFNDSAMQVIVLPCALPLL